MKREDAQFEKEFEARGMWWLPGAEDKAVGGTLTYDPERGLTLETLGDFFGGVTGILPNPNHDVRDIILGRSQSGTEITLHRCHRANHTISFGGYSSQSFRALQGFFGKHFSKPEEIVFESISFSATHLESWLGAIPFSIDLPEDGKKIGRSMTLKFQPPEHFKIFSKTLDAQIESSHTMKTKSDGWFDRRWTYQSLLLIKPSQPKDFEWFVSQASDIKNLVALLTGERIYFRTLSFSFSKSDKGGVYAIFSQSREPKKKKSVHPQEMLVPFVSIAPQLEQTLDAWLRDSKELGPVHDLLFSVMYKPDLYIQSQLLHLMQAIETFHRRTRGGHYVEAEEFNKIQSALKNAIPDGIKPEFKDVLRGKLQYMNELSLRSRMKALVSDLPAKLTERFLGNSKTFVNELCETRDHLTHYSKDSKIQSSKEIAQRYYRFVTQLTVMLTYYLLKQIEISDEAICKGILQKYHYLPKPPTGK